MTDEIELLPEPQIRAEVRRRRDKYIRERIPSARQAEYEKEGWVLDKALKLKVWMRKPKSHDVAFEDEVWAMFARVGFTRLSKDRSLRISYGKAPNERKQIDVLAGDGEVVLIVECKSSDKHDPPTIPFKTEVESIVGYRQGLIGTVRQQFPGAKVKFVFATNNINVTKESLERIENADIAYLNEEAVSYYHGLADHLGEAAKYQLLGNIFRGVQIPSMEATVPAIEGRMGGHKYYSFVIEPARLLKIAYVLHLNNANKRWTPTYQRLIKKTRLKRVADFVAEGGFFPNSLILSIDNGGKPLRFDRSEKQVGAASLGVLHLPKKYRSAFVIDGQHRLYGFAQSSRADTELVPVVAFVDLAGAKQLEVFMQINENQQAISKSLQNTLNADLLWASPNKREQAKALKLKIAQALGERGSPLLGRVVIGEEQTNDRRCISLDYLQRGIDRGRFIGEFTATGVKSYGSFYRTSNDDTLEPLTVFLIACFEFLRDELPTQWNLGKADSGFVFTNPGSEAILRLIGDFVDHLTDAGTIDPRTAKPEEVFLQVRPLLASLAEHLRTYAGDAASEFKNLVGLGSAAPTKYLRHVQRALSEMVPGFDPAGLSEWIEDQEKQFNTDSYTMVREVEDFLRVDIRRRLEDAFAANWYRDGVPKKVYQAAQTLRAQKQYDAGPGEQIEWWDCLHLIDYLDIFTHGGMKLWNELYDDTYTLPSDTKASSWKEKPAWMIRLNEIRNKIAHNGSVTEDEFGFLQSVHSHLDLGGTGGDQ